MLNNRRVEFTMLANQKPGILKNSKTWKIQKFRKLEKNQNFKAFKNVHHVPLRLMKKLLATVSEATDLEADISEVTIGDAEQ